MSANEDVATEAQIHSPLGFGRFIRSERRRRGMTQVAFAAEIGVSSKWLSDAENGKPTIELGLALATLRGLGYTLLAVEQPEPEFDFDAHMQSLIQRG